MGALNFRSRLAPYIIGLIEQKRALGYKYTAQVKILQKFDMLCAERFSEDSTVTKAMLDVWAVKGPEEAPGTLRHRVTVIAHLAQHIASLGFYAYEENLEDGTVKNQKEYEDYWKSEFPDEVEWYHFVAVEHTDIKYRCVFLSNKQVLEMDKRLESGYTHDISEFTEWLVDAVKLTIEAVRNGTYNESVARLLPYKHRTGVITRAGLWKLYPEEKESFFEALTQEDVDEFLATGTEDCTGLPELKEMTADAECRCGCQRFCTCYL